MACDRCVTDTATVTRICCLVLQAARSLDGPQNNEGLRFRRWLCVLQTWEKVCDCDCSWFLFTDLNFVRPGWICGAINNTHRVCSSGLKRPRRLVSRLPWRFPLGPASSPFLKSSQHAHSRRRSQRQGALALALWVHVRWPFGPACAFGHTLSQCLSQWRDQLALALVQALSWRCFNPAPYLVLRPALMPRPLWL